MRCGGHTLGRGEGLSPYSTSPIQEVAGVVNAWKWLIAIIISSAKVPMGDWLKLDSLTALDAPCKADAADEKPVHTADLTIGHHGSIPPGVERIGARFGRNRQRQ